MPVQIIPRLGEFSEACVSISEISEFYNLTDAEVPEDRPYTWSMTVASMDGCISFSSPGVFPSAIALSSLQGGGSQADWRMLNAGWAHADAVLISGACLRDEPHMKCKPCFDDLITYRTSHLRHTSRHPTNVILTASGSVNLSHPILNDPELTALIVTTTAGYKQLLLQILDRGCSVTEAQLPTSEDSTGSVTVYSVHEAGGGDGAGSEKAPVWLKIVVPVAGDESGTTSSGGVPYMQMLRYLRVHEGVRYLDVSAGGVVIGGLLSEKLVDEVRLTLAGHVVGTATKEGVQRPPFVCLPAGSAFGPDDSVLVRYAGVRLFGEHHMFLRGLVSYRH